MSPHSMTFAEALGFLILLVLQVVGDVKLVITGLNERMYRIVTDTPWSGR